MTKQDSVPMNDLKRLYQRYQGEIEREVANTLRSGWWLNGAVGKRFAANFSKFIGVSECVLVANGTDALELALAAVTKRDGMGGREVIIAANAGVMLAAPAGTMISFRTMSISNRPVSS